MLKKVVLMVVLVVLGASLIGCQTIQGVGEDIKSVGEAGERAID